VQPVRNLLFSLLNPFSQGLSLSSAFVVSALDLAFRSLDPTEGDGEIDRHEDMLVTVDEGDAIGDIFLVADLVILCVLVERSLVFADYCVVLIDFLV